MASTRNYLNYLNDQVDIAPANSQEELDAAHLVKELMDEHGLDTTLQEFDMPVAGDLAHSIVYLLLFVGIVLGGVLGSAAGAIGRVIVLVGIILLALRFGGYDILANLGPKARSQNVIGVHRASGPLVVKGNRPIVIVAHYDTPNEGLLWRRTLCLLVRVHGCDVLSLPGDGLPSRTGAPRVLDHWHRGVPAASGHWRQ